MPHDPILKSSTSPFFQIYGNQGGVNWTPKWLKFFSVTIYDIFLHRKKSFPLKLKKVFIWQTLFKVNIQDFLQVFQVSGIGKMEDNLTSADPLSYTTNGSRGDLQILGYAIRGRHHSFKISFVFFILVWYTDTTKFGDAWMNTSHTASSSHSNSTPDVRIDVPSYASATSRSVKRTNNQLTPPRSVSREGSNPLTQHIHRHLTSLLPSSISSNFKKPKTHIASCIQDNEDRRWFYLTQTYDFKTNSVNRFSYWRL